MFIYGIKVIVLDFTITGLIALVHIADIWNANTRSFCVWRHIVFGLFL